jgi:hypothetical protein
MMNLGDLGSIASLASLPAAAFTIWASFRSPGIARTFMLVIALPIAIAAYTIDVSDRLGLISTPESEQMKACRTIQAAAHDQIQTLEHEIQSAYTTIDNDQKALTEQTRLRVAAAEQDRVIGKDRDFSSYSVNAEKVDERISQLSNDIDWRDKIIASRGQGISNVSNWVYSHCAEILAEK